jgi:hypothetical protein
MPSSLLIVITLAAVHFALREASFERAAHKGEKLYFPPIFTLRACFWFGTPLFLYSAVKTFSQIRVGTHWIVPVISVGLAALSFFSVPGTIILDDSGIRYTRYLGLVSRRIQWADIRSVVLAGVRQETVVFGNDGTAITHTQFNVDPSRFVDEVTRRSNVEMIHR